ncbi:MAG: DEAD/DEAH box helicase family protein [Synergistaceae bacterium]|jgi:type III restriction enzyme|nr:DEAD/DEAH box helicase family protein [Synergistaceae bacterium]
MKLQFRHQGFQADAAKVVCDVFAGQPFHTPTYMIDSGFGQRSLTHAQDFTGFNNAPVAITDDKILEHIRSIQRGGQIKPSDALDGRYNLTIEMETGVGKTYTYIKTMYELNKRYGWSKFIIVVPSVAIREGVYKSFQMTEEHFAEDYGKKIRFFIYNSAQLTEIDRFASDSAINVMIINSQAFNARGKDARRIYMKLDEFRSRRPIDILAKTNPILIIDEPQSVEGAATKERLREFAPLFTLRYSATHRPDSVYNMIYRLDALEAYNKRLVKKIAVKGVSVSGTATEGYVYIQSINISKGNPTATIEFDVKGGTSIRKVARVVTEGYNLFDNSGELAEYKDGYTVLRIDGRDSSVEFTGGKKLFAGDVIGSVSEEQLRRIQIRETILSHIERERQLFPKGIKVLSLFFIDEVAKYKLYDASGSAVGGPYAQIFEEEYKAVVSGMQLELTDTPEYLAYLDGIAAECTHAGYFSIDKKSGRMVDSKLGDRKERTSDDTDAYDLIMKDKERLLDRREPVRFIFSHSALREGWDNPNVFQICTLRQGRSDIRKRQEVGRGLRLAVNQSGERMDENLLSREEIHNVNVLTVVANESYDSFAKGLQSEIAEAVADRPRKVEAELFTEKFGEAAALAVYESLIENGYVRRGELTEKYYEDKKNGMLEVSEEADGRVADIIAVLDSVYDTNANKPENARKNTVDVTLDRAKLDSKTFQELWSRINSKSYYIVSFDEDELVGKSVAELNIRLRVSKIYFKVEKGEQAQNIESKAQLQAGEAFIWSDISRKEAGSYMAIKTNSSVRYDLVGKIVAETGLTRKAVAEILSGLEKAVFNQFGDNPEEFIIRTADIINEQKATAIIEHIAYDKLTSTFSTEIFTEPDLKKGCLGVNAMETKRNLYDYVIYDSTNERDFAAELETHQQEVEVYVKLPRGFYISTPVGKYNPDWAIAFYEGKVKHIYFVAETKGDMSSMELRKIDEAKAHCAREHFRAISGGDVVYDVVDSYDRLWELVRI